MKKGFITGLSIILSIFVLTSVSALRNVTSSSNILNNQVIIPQNLQMITKILFDLNPSLNFNLQQLIILFMLWLISLLVIWEAVSLLINKSWASFALSFIITCLISLSGGFLDAGGYISAPLINNSVYFVMFILVLVIFGFVIVKLVDQLKKRVNLSEIEQMGIEIGLKKKV